MNKKTLSKVHNKIRTKDIKSKFEFICTQNTEMVYFINNIDQDTLYF